MGATHGNVAEIYARSAIEGPLSIKLKKKRNSRKITLIILHSALVTLLLGITILIVFK